nr:uncharacterized protein CTRU02_07824 [Colletotrichum truncatum]KAF6790918.1 hypothetical protein CTRU02_07824 [Colletotrichum truncatum]
MLSVRFISLLFASFLVTGAVADGGSGIAGSPCSKQRDCCACDVNQGQQLTCKVAPGQTRGTCQTNGFPCAGSCN